MKDQTQKYIREIIPGVTLFKVDIEQLSKSKYGIKSELSLPQGQVFNIELQNEIEGFVSGIFKDYELEFFWVELPQSMRDLVIPEAEPTPEERLYRSIEIQWQSFVRRALPSSLHIEEQTISWQTLAEDEVDTEYYYCPELPEYRLCIPGQDNPEFVFEPESYFVPPVRLTDRVKRYNIDVDISYILGNSNTEADIQQFSRAIEDFEAAFAADEMQINMRLFPYRVVGE